MIEVLTFIAIHAGAMVLGLLAAVYVAGTLVVLHAFFNERNPLSHVIYLPSLLLWPITVAQRLWPAKEGKSDVKTR